MVVGALLGGAMLAGCEGTQEKQPSSSAAASSRTTTSWTGSATSAVSLTPVRKVFDPAAIRDGVKRVLTDSYQVADVGEVSCPADQEAKSGNTFNCTVDVGGKDKTVIITVNDDNGQYEVGQPR